MENRKRRPRRDNADALPPHDDLPRTLRGSRPDPDAVLYTPEETDDFMPEGNLAAPAPRDRGYAPAERSGSGASRRASRRAAREPEWYGLREDEPMEESSAGEAQEEYLYDQEPIDAEGYDSLDYDGGYTAPDSKPRAQPARAEAHPTSEARLRHPSPARGPDQESPNPTPPRKWPLYLFVSLTALLVFISINVERQREDSEHWAAPEASAINDTLVPRVNMGPPESLPTKIPQSYLDAAKAAFSVNEELATPTPFATSPPVTDTPAPTSVPLLKKGMQGEFIRTVQERLVALNYLQADQVDGKYEGDTIKAVKEFQESSYLPADGLAGKDTLEYLFLPGASAKPTFTPIPTRLDEPYVWATKNGTYYHSEKDCSNMKGATELPLSQAKADGKKACTKCNPAK